MSIYDVFNGGSKPFDKAEWAAQKQAQRNTQLQTLFWYRRRCPKRHSLKTTTLGSRAVSM